MIHKGTLALAAALVVVATCAPAEGPPEITVDRTACDACGMLVSETRYAAAYRLPGEEARIFDDVGCLLKGLAEEGDSEAAEIWVQDSVAGGWQDARRAWYVRSRSLATPMGSGLRAVRDEEAARALAGRSEGATALDFDGLVEPVPLATDESSGNPAEVAR